MEFPLFDENFQFLNQFVLELVEAHNAGDVDSWDELETRVKFFFTNEIMDTIESMAPGWKKMASYSGGITLTHVTCVFLGMFMLPEFQALSDEQQQIAKWIILFHDIDKTYISGKKDTMHAFNSAVVAANTLPSLGFPATDKYHELIDSWSEYIRQAFTTSPAHAWLKPDNSKLPKILAEINLLFGKGTPAAVITKIILLHISLESDRNYPTPAPLTEEEITQFISADILPLVVVMYLADNEGWSMFDPEVRGQQKNDRLQYFEGIQKLIKAAVS